MKMTGNYSGEITDNILDYLLGGHARFTLVQDPYKGKPGNSQVYKIVHSRNADMYLVYVEVNSSSKYMCYFLQRDLLLRLGNKGSVGLFDSYSRPLQVVLSRLKSDGRLPGNGVVHIYGDGVCSRCNRRLTDVDSIKYGIGPTCRKKLGLG